MFFSKNIRFLRHVNNLTQESLAEKLGYRSFTTIQKWESGDSTPSLDKVALIAEVFNVDIDDLYGKDLQTSDFAISQLPGEGKIPIYRNYPAHTAVNDKASIIGYIDAPHYISSCSDYFAIVIHGDSMLPDYRSGDIVIFQKASNCRNGDDCAFRIDNRDVDVKRIRVLEDSVILQPLNPEFEPVYLKRCGDGLPMEIMGVAKEIRRKLK